MTTHRGPTNRRLNTVTSCTSKRARMTTMNALPTPPLLSHQFWTLDLTYRSSWDGYPQSKGQTLCDASVMMIFGSLERSYSTWDGALEVFCFHQLGWQIHLSLRVVLIFSFLTLHVFLAIHILVHTLRSPTCRVSCGDGCAERFVEAHTGVGRCERVREVTFDSIAVM